MRLLFRNWNRSRNRRNPVDKLLSLGFSYRSRGSGGRLWEWEETGDAPWNFIISGFPNERSHSNQGHSAWERGRTFDLDLHQRRFIVVVLSDSILLNSILIESFFSYSLSEFLVIVRHWRMMSSFDSNQKMNC